PHIIFAKIKLYLSTNTTAIDLHTFPLHDALPISLSLPKGVRTADKTGSRGDRLGPGNDRHRRIETPSRRSAVGGTAPAGLDRDRSEEHTSELQSRENIVCRLLLEKKKK